MTKRIRPFWKHAAFLVLVLVVAASSWAISGRGGEEPDQAASGATSAVPTATTVATKETTPPEASPTEPGVASTPAEASTAPAPATAPLPPATPQPPPTAVPTLAPLSVRSFGATGDGRTDDTEAIRAALAALPDGRELSFPAGTYLYSDQLVIGGDDVVISGLPGALLVSASPVLIHQIILDGSNVTLQGINARASVTKRHSWSNYLLVLRGPNQTVTGSSFDYGGILVQGARDCLIAGNQVTNSQADSIRLTDAQNCRVLNNTVRFASDDMISVVSTVGARPLNSNILIEGNDLAHQFWGRGIAVVGGEKVTIRRNLISDLYAGAGIIIAQEDDFNTHGVRNILIEGNQILNVQTTGQPKGGVRVGHGAIVLNAESDTVRDILIRNNVVTGTARDGLDVRRNACGVALIDNLLDDIGRNPINLSSSVNPASCSVVCIGNVYQAQTVAAEQCGGIEPTVTGYQP